MEDCTWNKTNCPRKQEGYIVLPLTVQFIAITDAENGVELWHKTLGQMSQTGLDILLPSQKLVTKGNMLDFCNDCLYGKQVKSFYNTSSSKKTIPLELIHYDLCTERTKFLEGSLHSLMITLESVGHIF